MVLAFDALLTEANRDSTPLPAGSLPKTTNNKWLMRMRHRTLYHYHAINGHWTY